MRKHFWVGGSPCAGKSTITNLLAEQLGWEVYRVDEHTDAHFKRSTAVSHPTFHHLMQLQGDALWMRPVEKQFQDEIAFCADQFSLILEDVEKMEGEETAVIEGTSLLPHLIASQLDSLHEAIWLVPTPTFQQEHYAKRPWINGILSQCSNPDQAWENWMQRDILFARWVIQEAKRLDLHIIEVDGSRTIGKTTKLVQAWFKQ